MTSLTPISLTKNYQKNGSLSPRIVTAFRTNVYAYFHANPRPMPWRETTDPYRILVSEIMLQQTQVERVKIKYAEFLTVFPTVFELAAASLASVLQVWQGLGYNRRAVFLKRCSEEIVTYYGGQFPRSIAELQSLPGIGPYTARAVAAFAFGIAAPLIETNVRTVYIHFFFHGRATVSDREIMPLVEATLDQENPREWYYALMDYGVMLKQTLPNPGRRSTHHIQQSRFEGSNRQLRGRMLRAIMKQPHISVKELLAALRVERELILSNLEAMRREGFLVKRERGYCIAGEYKRG
ncbi:MAG: A/G-specific adenine glycosylase [Desulfuromonadaceae bacterium]|nr:A/G-specific adenine glycosylase [Desulfuromonadaceae bacterium]